MQCRCQSDEISIAAAIVREVKLISETDYISASVRGACERCDGSGEELCGAEKQHIQDAASAQALGGVETSQP